ncbi:MAG TPA: acyltransferase [Hypericibacter adhaerens]|uniref:acyltransferase family protein n=1 Tax=Hypericibacter adhaerens TaxID=2602016 RepID=UPI002D0A6752|nr:acyltransferase [Hypericibacter adhaerens]HWA44312.1 acyltransferase [Hypericibacter adhaerens]
MRAIAATLVLAQHAVYFAGLTEGEDMMAFRYLYVGAIGVFLFFMISGFVMALQTGQPARRFALHRLLRIYPGYLLASLVNLLLLALFLPGALQDPRFEISLLLLPSGSLSPMLQVPYWSLIYEIVFYFLLFLAIALKLRPAIQTAFMLVWALLILMAPALSVRSDFWASAGAGTILFSPFNLYFIGGFLLCGALQHGRRFALALWLAMILVESLWRGAVMNEFHIRLILCGGAGLALASLLPWIPWPRLLARIGDWSYGLYLVHLPIIVALYQLLKDDGPGFWPAFAIFFGAGLAGGSAFGGLEYWLYRRSLRPLADRLSGKSVSSGARDRGTGPVSTVVPAVTASPRS